MKTKLYSIIIALLLSQMVFGQALITLDECLEAAKKSASTTKQKEIELGLAQLNAQMIQSSWLPQISLVAQSTYQSDVTGLNIELPNVRMTPINKDQYKTFVDINQLIYDGGANRIKWELQQLGSKNNLTRIEIANRTIQQETQKIYFSALMAQENRIIWETAKEEIFARKRVLETSIQFGTRTKNQLDILSVELIKLEQQITDIVAAQKIAVEMLSLLTGLNLTNNTHFQIPNEVKALTPISYQTFEMDLLHNQQEVFSKNQALNESKTRPKAFIFSQTGYGNPALNMLKNEFQGYYLVGARLNWDISSLYTKRLNKKSEQLQRELITQHTLDLERQISMQHVKISEEVNRYEKLIQQDQSIIALRERISQTANSELDLGIITATQYITEKNADKMAQQAHLLHKIQKMAFQQEAKLLFSGNSSL
jgi:outer membrane protein TolC